MQLTPETLLLVFLGFMLVSVWYQSTLNRHRIWCTFHRRDGTDEHKFIKDSQGRIEWAGGWYNVRPVVTIDWRLLFGIIPLPVRALYWHEDNAEPINPQTGASYDPTPSERKRLDTTDEIRAYDEGGRQGIQGVKAKGGLLQQYLPIIVIGGFVVIGFFIYTLMSKVNLLGTGQNYIEQQLGQIINHMPK